MAWIGPRSSQFSEFYCDSGTMPGDGSRWISNLIEAKSDKSLGWENLPQSGSSEEPPGDRPHRTSALYKSSTDQFFELRTTPSATQQPRITNKIFGSVLQSVVNGALQFEQHSPETTTRQRPSDALPSRHGTIPYHVTFVDPIPTGRIRSSIIMSFPLIHVFQKNML